MKKQFKKLVGFVRETLWYFKAQLDRGTKAVNKMLVLDQIKNMLCRVLSVVQKNNKQKVCLHKKER
jgi:hypothetical protein